MAIIKGNPIYCVYRDHDVVTSIPSDVIQEELATIRTIMKRPTTLEHSYSISYKFMRLIKIVAVTLGGIALISGIVALLN